MPAESKSQQRFMGMVHAYQKGSLDTSKMDPNLARKVQKASKSISQNKAEMMAATKHTGLPEKVAALAAFTNELKRLTKI